jgi:hypothetical protein
MAAFPYVPNKGTSDNDIQSQSFALDFEIAAAAREGLDCILFGLVLSQQGSPDMTIAGTRGAVLSNGTLFAVAAGNWTIGTADATNPRIDLLVINSSGARAVRAGTAAAAPKPPARTANDVVCGYVFVAANDTTMTEGSMTRARMALRTNGPINVKDDVSLQTTNTTSTIFTVASLTIPRQLFDSSVSTWRGVRIRTAGNYLSNSGTPTWTWTISYNGVTLFADATGATTAGASRGAWDIDVMLKHSAAAVQQLTGQIRQQTPGAKTAPTTGTAGDLAVTTHVNAPIYAASTQDNAAGDMDILVRCTMSVSNAAVETVRAVQLWELF